MGKTLLYNGQIITVNNSDEIADAILFENKRILFVGKTAQALRFADKYTEWIDLQGCAVLPGFIDSHIHMAVAGAKIENQVDVSKKAGVKTVKDLIDKIKEAESDQGSWIIGSNYNHEGLGERRHITKQELDEAVPDQPVLIIHTSGHMSVANTKALEIAKNKGLDLNMPQVVKNEDGSLTGLLRETAHFEMLERSPVIPNDSQLVLGIEKFCKSLLSKGITSVQDAGGFGRASFRTLQQAKEQGKLSCRTYTMLWTLFGKNAQLNVADTAMDLGFFSGMGDDMLKIGPIKLMVDGSAVGGTCASSTPLLNVGKLIDPSFSQQELDQAFIEGHKAGFQLTAHAVGDKAIEMVLNSYEKAIKKHPRKDHRHRIEHCFLCSRELAERIKELGVIPVPNPGFISVWGEVFEKYYGDRLEKVIPLKTFKDLGIVTPFGSDAMVIEEYEPLFGIAAAMERRDLKSDRVIGEEQKIDLLHAIRCYTYFGAYAAFEENQKGSLEPGKIADIIVLSDSILDKTPEEIRKLRVRKTYVGGTLVFNGNLTEK